MLQRARSPLNGAHGGLKTAHTWPQRASHPQTGAAVYSAAAPRTVRAHATGGAATAAPPPPVVVAGAGIAGLATAVALHKAGLNPLVLERAPAPRDEGAAIGLWPNAFRALDALGVSDALRASAPQLLTRIELVRSTGRSLRAFGLSECSAAAKGGRDAEFRGVRRRQLLAALSAALPPECVRFGCTIEAVESDVPNGPMVRLSDGSTQACSVLVGADGVGSAVGKHLGLAAPNYAGYTAYRGVAQMPAGLPLPRDTVRQMYGDGVRAGMYPLSDSEVYWFTCFNAPEDAPAPDTPEGQLLEALSYVDGWAWGIGDAIRASPVLTRSRVRDRWTAGAFGRGLVTLAGDAAHPMTPNLGQGGCAALEDAVVLARELKQAATGSSSSSSSGQRLDPAAAAEALRRYENERWRRCLPLTIRSWAFGTALQLPYPPVTLARDTFMSTAFNPSHFLDHTAYDCGTI